jgi:hypothetical protein
LPLRSPVESAARDTVLVAESHRRVPSAPIPPGAAPKVEFDAERG